MTTGKSLNVLEQLKLQLVTALNSIGIDAKDIFTTERGIALPFADMQITLKTEKGQRVWQCTERFATMGLGDDQEKTKIIIRFEEPMEHPLRMARAIAVYIATTRIDAALDSVA